MARAIAVVLTLGVALERGASAGGGPETDAYEEISNAPIAFRALADLYVADNLDHPSDGTSALRAFDRVADAPAIGLLRLELAHAPSPIGFRLDLSAGDVSTLYFESDPAASEHRELSRALSHVTQGFVTAVVDNLEIDVGKFDTPVGLEDNEANTNWNYSRSFVYTWDEPTMHSGVRATYQPTKTVAVAAFWLNGWNANIYDGSTMRSYALAARWRPCDAIELVLVYAGGLERAPAASSGVAPLSFRNAVDSYAIYHPLPWLGLALTGDYVEDRALGGVHFYGVAGYARAEVNRHFAGALRGELFADPSGYATGTVQTLSEATATLETTYVVRGIRTQARLEARHDHSNADVFARDADLARTQTTVTLALLATW